MSCTRPQTSVVPIHVTRGASKTLLFTARADVVTGEMSAAIAGVDQVLTGSPVDLTGAKVWFTVKNRVEDVAAVTTKRNVAAGGIDNQVLVATQTGPTVGQFRVFIDSADTAPLDPVASLWCDVWIQLPGGPPFNRQQVRGNGPIVVDPAVTTAF